MRSSRGENRDRTILPLPSMQFHTFVTGQQGLLMDGDPVQAFQPFLLRQPFGDEQGVEVFQVGEADQLGVPGSGLTYGHLRIIT